MCFRKKSLIGAGMATLLWGSCRLQKPHFEKIDNVAVRSISLNQINIQADLILHNPNRVSITLMDVYIEVFSGDNLKLTSIRQVFQSRVPSKSDFVVPVKITFDPKSLFLQPRELLGLIINASRQRELELIVKGNSRIRRSGITISIPIDSKALFSVGGPK